MRWWIVKAFAASIIKLTDPLKKYEPLMTVSPMSQRASL